MYIAQGERTIRTSGDCLCPALLPNIWFWTGCQEFHKSGNPLSTGLYVSTNRNEERGKHCLFVINRFTWEGNKMQGAQAIIAHLSVSSLWIRLTENGLLTLFWWYRVFHFRQSRIKSSLWIVSRHLRMAFWFLFVAILRLIRNRTRSSTANALCCYQRQQEGGMFRTVRTFPRTYRSFLRLISAFADIFRLNYG